MNYCKDCNHCSTEHHPASLMCRNPDVCGVGISPVYGKKILPIHCAEARESRPECEHFKRAAWPVRLFRWFVL